MAKVTGHLKLRIRITKVNGKKVRKKALELKQIRMEEFTKAFLKKIKKKNLKLILQSTR